MTLSKYEIRSFEEEEEEAEEKVSLLKKLTLHSI